MQGERKRAVRVSWLCTAYRNLYRYNNNIILIISVTSSELFQARIPEGAICLFLQLHFSYIT